MDHKFFTLSVETVLQKLNSNINDGLSENEAKQRIKTYGPNDIEEKKQKSKLKIFIDQFRDPIIAILAAAGLLTFIFSEDLPETIAILVVILITVIIGFIMELQGVRSLEALRKMGGTESRVLRDGKIKIIKASLLVPGDIILVEAGDVVSADARLISVENLAVKEASLTGESRAIQKNTDVLADDTLLADTKNMIFKGTAVEQGSAKAIVVHTALNTQLGKIQQMGSDVKEGRTPLEKKLGGLSKGLIWLTLVFAVLIIFTGYIRGLDMLLIIQTAIALAVAAIPEGLPIVATIALARGMLKLSKQQVIIKQMEAVETLGATNVICTDKTGTLTEDKMLVHTLVFEDLMVSEIQTKDEKYFEDFKTAEAIDAIIDTGVLCNNIILDAEELRGDSIELALIHFAQKFKRHPQDIKANYPRLEEIPFTTERKLMATLNKNESQGFSVHVKGAFENVIEHCNTILKNGEIQEFKNKKEWEDRVHDLASQGLRVLAFAHKIQDKKPQKKHFLSQLTFIGVIGFLDPARADVKDTINVYKEAGIKVVMMTGDHPGTAKKIAAEIGLLPEIVTPYSVIHGKDLKFENNLTEDSQNNILEAAVFARVTPEQKLNLITYFQEHNNVVGMFGDGINDIPALRKADIGIAMGVRGTQAAREASDIILKNDKFTAMELAISQGRAIFDHIRQFVVFLLSCNLAEVVSVGLAALLSLPAPLLPLQILFLNLVTDIFPALALGMGEGEIDIMKRPPRAANAPIMTKKLWKSTIIYGLSITASVVGITAYAYTVLEASSEIINNMAFYTLVLAQLLNVFNMAESNVSFFKNEIVKNPWVWSAIAISLIITVGAYLIPPIANALYLTPLSLEQILWVVVFALGSLVLSQIIKRAGGTF